MDKKLASILNNTTAGSSELLLLLNDYLSVTIKSTAELEMVIPEIKKRFQSFSVITNYLDRVQMFCKSNDYEGYLNFARQTANENQRKYLSIYKNAKAFLKNTSTVITLSNSTTLLEVFKLWKHDNNNLKIIIAESRPKEEGKIFAVNLLRNNITTQLITDSMMAMFVKSSEAAIIGADQGLKNGSIVNKAGSRLLAMAAMYYNKPFYVIASKDKMSGATDYNPQEYPPEEIWDYKHSNLEIKNYYFENVEQYLITRIITD